MGTLPFRGETSGVDLQRHSERDSRTCRASESGRAGRTRTDHQQNLEKDRNIRYQSASELRADLKRLKRDTDSGKTLTTHEALAATTSAKTAPVVNQLWWRWAALLAAGALFALGILTWLRWPVPPARVLG